MSEQSRHNSDKLRPEELGAYLGLWFFGLMILFTVLYMFLNLFVLSVVFPTEPISVALLFSIVATVIIPSLIIRLIKPYLKGIFSEIINRGFSHERGKEDRRTVVLSLALIAIGIAAYVFSPPAFDANEVHLTTAIQAGLGLQDIIESLYVDLFSICGIGTSGGFSIVAWYITNYPRYCSNCGNRQCLDQDFCPSCGSSLDGRPSRFENLVQLAKDKDRTQTTASADSSEKLAEGSE